MLYKLPNICIATKILQIVGYVLLTDGSKIYPKPLLQPNRIIIKYIEINEIVF